MRYSDLFESAITYSTMTGVQLYYDVLTQKENNDAGKRIKYLNSSYNDIQNETDFVAFSGTKVIGVAGIWKAPEEPNVIWIPYLSVDPKYSGSGVGKTLAEMIFKYAKENELKVRSSSYTEQGSEKLKHVFERLAKMYSVPFKDGADHTPFK